MDEGWATGDAAGPAGERARAASSGVPGLAGLPGRPAPDDDHGLASGDAIDDRRRQFVLTAGRLILAGSLPALGLAGCCDDLEHTYAAINGGRDDERDGDPQSDATAGSGDDTVSNRAALPPIPDREPIVRVRLRRWPSDAIPTFGRGTERIRVERVERFAERVDERDERDVAAIDAPRDASDAPPRVLDAPIRLRLDIDGWTIVDRTGRQHRIDVPAGSRGALRLQLADGAPGGAIVHDDRPWPGTLVAVPRRVLRPAADDDAAPRGRDGGDRSTPTPPDVDVIDHLPIEQYLPGVLAAELISSWHPETFAAQAVAARSFAVFEAAAWARSRHYDLESDERSQVFAGGRAPDVAIEAVARTRGQLVTYADGVVPAYFSSTCGGVGPPASSAIGPHPANAVPPLAGHALLTCCKGSPRYEWTVERTRDRVRRQLRQWGADRGDTALAELGPIVAIRPDETTTAGGRPLRYRIEGALPTGDDGRDTGNGATRTMATIDAPSFRRALNARRRNGETLLWSDFVEVTVDAQRGTVRLDGRGFGHGVGLCQYGAQAMARAGQSWRAIIAAYYPGNQVRRGWGDAAT